MVLTLGALVLLAYALFGASPYGLRVLTVAGVYALAAMGFQIVFGAGGALSLAQGAFFGLGAYVTGILGTAAGLGFAVTFPLSLLVPLVVAVAVGLPVLRLESHYFALATLGIAQVLFLLAVNLPDVTGGANGIAGVPGVVLGVGAAGDAVPRGLPLAALVWGLVAVGGIVAARLLAGRWGRALALVRGDPLTAATLGLDVGRLRLGAFAVSAVYGGAAGALAAHTQRVVSPEVLEFPVMVSILTITLVGGAMAGGRGRVAGAVIGAVLLLHVPEWFRFLERSYLIVYGAALLLVTVLAPHGLMGVVERLFPQPPRAIPPAREPVAHLHAALAGPVLAVEGVRKSFGGVVAVDGVSFTAAAGEVVGIIGPNGSGKTTLINLVSGVERAEDGAVRLGGVDMAGRRADRLAAAGLSRSFQSAVLPEHDTVLDAVAGARLSLDPSVAAARAHARAVVERMGLGDVMTAPCAGLPAAVRRRVDLARAVARRPRVLLLDEPAAGLGEAEKDSLAAQIRRLAADGMAVVVVEHDMGFLLPLAGRLVALDQGRVVASGVPSAVVNHPAVLGAYLGGSL